MGLIEPFQHFASCCNTRGVSAIFVAHFVATLITILNGGRDAVMRIMRWREERAERGGTVRRIHFPASSPSQNRSSPPPSPSSRCYFYFRDGIDVEEGSRRRGREQRTRCCCVRRARKWESYLFLNLSSVVRPSEVGSRRRFF